VSHHTTYQTVGNRLLAFFSKLPFRSKETAVNIGILGTGTLAVALGRVWTSAGHTVSITGRNNAHAAQAASDIGPTAQAVAPDTFATTADIVIIAVAWNGLEPALELINAPQGSLAGKTVVDCTNAVDFTTGRLLLTSGSAAEAVARIATGAHVVKALHLFAGASWPFEGPEDAAPVVPLCGDSPTALDQTAALIQDLGGRTAVIGGLDTARQVEEAAGFVMRIVAAGFNPRFAVPDVRLA
jgi:predicted dinucleotide-binding enzyme